ncbi:MAG: diguanylate cyclase [Nitrospirae bacterium]|nr:diguanylate cyclase [Nitrospirota bacterium]
MKKQLKREGLKKAAFPSILALAYILFIFPPDFIKTEFALIIGFSILFMITGTGLYRYVRYIKTGFPFSGWKSLEFLLPFLLFFEGLIQLSGRPLLHLVYIPFIVIISSNFPLAIVISCITAIFLLSIPGQWWVKGYLTGEGGSYLSILITGISSYFIFSKKTKLTEKAVQDLRDLKSKALDLDTSAEASLFDEDRFSHLVKSVLDTERELRKILDFMKKIMQTDSITLFFLEDNKLSAKASTEDLPKPEYHKESYLKSVISWRKPLIQSQIRDGLFDFGFKTPKRTIHSSLCVPVFDGDIPLGVVEIVNSRAHAFGEREEDIAFTFTSQIVDILRKARIYMEVTRFAKGFKSLHDAGRMFSTSLKLEDIAVRLVELIFGMVGSSAVGFFIPDKGKLRIIAKKGFQPEEESFYPKGTFFDHILKSKQLLHISRMNKEQAINPFRMPDARTFYGIPIISSEQAMLGILAISSKEPDAISSFDSHFLSILADQASLAITNATLHKEVEKLAMTDGLTGLYNHKQFQQRLGEEFQRAERMPQPITLMLIDLDHFKKINDTHGHQAGDAVLVGVSAMLKKTLRGIDIIARYGGEEFAAVLLNAESGGAKKIAERLRTKVMNTPFFEEEKKLHLTLSVGISTYPHDASTKEELINRADQSLYYAKNHGRNQVCVWKDVEGRV